MVDRLGIEQRACESSVVERQHDNPGLPEVLARGGRNDQPAETFNIVMSTENSSNPSRGTSTPLADQDFDPVMPERASETMTKPRKRVAVIMQCRAIANKWQSQTWEPVGILADYAGEDEPRVIVEEPGITQWLYPGFDIVLQRSEAEGYFHNVSTAVPNLFVLWRTENARAVPRYVTASYDEASRWMDGGAQVDPVAMPLAMCAWVRAFVALNYRPEPKKRFRPQSFRSPKDRA